MEARSCTLRAVFAIGTGLLLLQGLAPVQAAPVSSLSALGAALRGELHILSGPNGTDPSNPGFDQLMPLWDQLYAGPAPYLPPSIPSLYVVAKAPEDVVSALEYALLNGVKTSIIGNGHQQAMVAWTQGGLVIDMTNLQDIVIDQVARTVAFQPGVTGGLLANATMPFNLMYAGPHASGVGVSGFTLGGGLGWNGIAVDLITGFDVVNTWTNASQGLSIVHVNATSYPDLFWALRGAGQMIGFVTRFYANLKPVTADNLPTTTAIFPLPLAPAGFKALQSLYSLLVPDYDASIILAHTPQGPAGIFSQYAYNSNNRMITGLLQEGLSTAKNAGAPVVIPGNITYAALVVAEDAAQDYPGVASYTQTIVIKNMTSDVFNIALGLLANATSNNSIVGVFPPTYSPLSQNDTAYGWRGYWQVWVWAFWTRTDGGAAVDGDAKHIAWARSGAQALKDYSLGQYLNMAPYTSVNDTQTSFPADHWARIVAAKRTYDPANLARELDYYRVNGGTSAKDGSSDGAVGAANHGVGAATS
ncbi:hypothetical protein WJX72_001874 [[Myrmecia] bisecta]|uniref:FAD-binding PCMH-type domain-containing protein n=1 Tax=[Myrmecia] bisecta TaxID=41462 RepID=A0AAW1QP64_9CHLO